MNWLQHDSCAVSYPLHCYILFISVRLETVWFLSPPLPLHPKCEVACVETSHRLLGTLATVSDDEQEVGEIVRDRTRFGHQMSQPTDHFVVGGNRSTMCLC